MQDECLVEARDSREPPALTSEDAIARRLRIKGVCFVFVVYGKKDRLAASVTGLGVHIISRLNRSFAIRSCSCLIPASMPRW